MYKRIIVIGLIIVICAFFLLNRSGSGDDHFRNQVAVLTYHHIDPVESEYTISPERFREHLLALTASHYEVISAEELVRFINEGTPVPPNAVVITFDDGYESYYRYAYPELKQQGMTATNFLIVRSVGDREAETPFLTWDEIKLMHKDGFSFYSHTYDSHGFNVNEKGKQVSPLTNRIWLEGEQRMETQEEYETRVKADLSQAENALREQLGNTLSMLCLPHGRYSQTLVKLSSQVGIDTIFTGDYGLNSVGDHLVKRVTAGVPTLSGQGLIDKINKETTLLGKGEDLLKNLILQIRYRFF
ncbi:polysaccharide deacetylase family protein [Paenibacillus doosanensis]|uniref:Poly-beta-1,6-N-acetyl-D-glucosamine N-deacetylase n=1 Tax=Paenibacillus konkukensis TaxID=2020716 RepID=A0ABY4S3I3_9BACL|nr:MULTISPECIES: polysaccharide deacetylase family protein [Paenibacillus]MCS7463352.1 polysaccharide deacetylase family protein [Paenibacillus doosanensis]UQZ87659.1 Poly-beta-1,6-N-acetyl-D-glucosamine N-deacetylase precursor [Paenibacillus konkukensis]